MTDPRHTTTLDPPALTVRQAARIRRKLLRWYDRHRRDLPWRQRCEDPYAQWVAEIMLQQTRVETVTEYYVRFMRRFTDVNALARANHGEVLKHWEGLGYYRRIDNLHRAARIIRDAGGGIPSSAAALRNLPGVGEYTAAAIASIAFKERIAAVDGNVARVIARLFALPQDVKTSIGRTRVRALASQLIPRDRPGDFNQAWMDLGSMVCTPRSPKCPACPLATSCMAHSFGQAESLPVRPSNGGPDRPEVHLAAAVFLSDGKMLLRRRPKGGLWSGLWEFPSAELNPGSPPWRAVQRLADAAGLSLGEPLRERSCTRHLLTHRSLTFHIYVAAVRRRGKVRPVASERWVNLRGFRRLAMSTAHRRIFQATQSLVVRRLC